MLTPLRRLALPIAVGLAALPAPALAAKPKSAHSVLSSRTLWATVDVCKPADQPDTIGIRASMPGDGQARERLFVRFRVQYEDPSTHSWLDSAQADSGFLTVGSARLRAVQTGRSFQFKPAAGQTYTLRGAVSFQWRLGARVIRSTERTTTAGHPARVGSDPPSFSAATCVIP